MLGIAKQRTHVGPSLPRTIEECADSLIDLRNRLLEVNISLDALTSEREALNQKEELVKNRLVEIRRSEIERQTWDRIRQEYEAMRPSLDEDRADEPIASDDE